LIYFLLVLKKILFNNLNNIAMKKLFEKGFTIICLITTWGKNILIIKLILAVAK
jgi:hypothetical protein